MAKDLELDKNFTTFVRAKYKLLDDELWLLHGKFSNFGPGWKRCRGAMSHGYLSLTIRYKSKAYAFREHRLRWFLHYGFFPSKQIDHINRDKTDNRISNLRLVSARENQLNCYKLQRPFGKCKFIGVHYSKYSKKYVAKIHVEGTSMHFGYFTKAKEAALARDRYIREHDLTHRYKLNFPDIK